MGRAIKGFIVTVTAAVCDRWDVSFNKSGVKGKEEAEIGGYGNLGFNLSR